MQQNNGNFSMEQALAFARSPAGQKLIGLLRQKNDPALTNAANLATSGNTEEAKRAVSSLLSDPQIQALLKQFGG